MMVPVASGQHDELGKDIYINVPVPMNATPEETQQIINTARRNAGATTIGRPNLPGAPPPDPNAPPPVTPSYNPANPAAGNPLLGPIPGHDLPNTGYPGTPTNIPPAPAQAAPANAPNVPGSPPGTYVGDGIKPQAAPAQVNTPAASPGSKAIGLPDTPPNGYADWISEPGKQLQSRAQRGLVTLSPTAKADVLAGSINSGAILPLRIINGQAVYVGKSGKPQGLVP
jgi:hypothetical protein